MQLNPVASGLLQKLHCNTRDVPNSLFVFCSARIVWPNGVHVFGQIIPLKLRLVFFFDKSRKNCLRGSSTAPPGVYQSILLDVCPLSKSNLQSLDFVVNRFLRKLFKTSNNDKRLSKFSVFLPIPSW